MNKTRIIFYFACVLVASLTIVLIVDAQTTKTIQDRYGIRQVNFSIEPQYFTPEEIEIGTNEQAMRDEYNRAMNDLNTIINTSNPTNTQVLWAIKRLAEIEKKELQYHKKDIQP